MLGVSPHGYGYIYCYCFSTLSRDSHFPFSGVFLMTQILIFIKARESLLCQHVLGFMFWLYDYAPLAAVRVFYFL